MKSEWYSGTFCGLPSPSPMPNSPPEPMAMRDCTSCQPVFSTSDQGLIQMAMRSRTYSKEW